VIYLDTSAFLKLYVREAGSDLVQNLVTSQKDPLPVWEFQQVEMINALRLKVFWKEINADDATRLRHANITRTLCLI
jgi:predicted nucleic acid-binding protein